MRDKGDLVERMMSENKSHASLELFCCILRNAKRCIVAGRLTHLGISIGMSEAVKIQTPNIEAGIA